jgi:hypothetical protein
LHGRCFCQLKGPQRKSPLVLLCWGKACSPQVSLNFWAYTLGPPLFVCVGFRV